MGLLAVLLGGASIVGPIVAGDLFTVLVGIVFLVSGASHIAYGLHAKDWRNFLHFLFLAVGLFAGGILILMNLHFAVVASGTLLAILITIQGIHSILVGAGNRPLIRGLGPLAAGIGMLACAALIVSRWPESSDVSVGLWVGLALTAGGLSTVWLSWTTRHEDASPPLCLIAPVTKTRSCSFATIEWYQDFCIGLDTLAGLTAASSVDSSTASA